MPDPIDTEAGELKTVPDSRFRLNWPIKASFRERVGNEESRGSGGYLARNGNALGAYQLTPIALKDIGRLDSNGNWTEKSGVTDDNAFLFSPLKQEIALKEYLLANRRHAQTNGVLDQVGQTIHGIKDAFVVTEDGLAAAMHREGPTAVRSYLDFLAKQGWVSKESDFPAKLVDVFKHLETRLREFADAPYLRPHGH
jgi:hypothetical protein